MVGMVLEQLEKSVEANPDDPSLQFELGLYLWENGGDSEKAAEHFVLSVKLNPDNAAAFKYLGHYYLDLNQAAKCYQRVSVVLCDLFDRQGKEILEIAVSQGFLGILQIGLHSASSEEVV